MKVLENVVVALDFGAATDSVVEAAAQLNKVFDGEIHLLHVLPQRDDLTPEAQGLVATARQQAAARLSDIRDRLARDGTLKITERIVEGVPFDQIIEHAEELEANVIVVGSRSEEIANGSRLGTTAERLCRKASRPVWVVGPDSQGTPKSILCPVDCSAASARALQNAIHLARRFESHLVVLHVVRPVFSVPGLSSGDRLVVEAHVKAETSKFEIFLKDFDFHNVDWEPVVREGVPAEAIVTAASEFASDLLIMGSVGRTGLSRILLGSVAGKVARLLPCSMIMFKAEDAIRLKLEEDLSDLTSHHVRAHELLENGFLNEARHHFEHCIRTSDIFAPAWAGLADVYQRQDETEMAEQCRNTARRIEEALAWRQVEADVRRSHPLWNRT